MLSLLREGTFRFRMEDRPGGGLVLWFRIDDELPELGPIELSAEETERFAVHVEGLTDLIEGALQRRLRVKARDPAIFGTQTRTTAHVPLDANTQRPAKLRIVPR